MKLDDIKSILSRAGKMQFPENRDAVRALGADSMVLLKNNGILPMNRGKVALFGAGAVDTIYTGLFFNYVYTDKNVSVKEGLLENGFTFSTDTWLDKMEKAVKPLDKIEKALSKKESFSGKRYETPEVPITKADIAESVLGTDTCIYVIRHNLVGAGNYLKVNIVFPILNRQILSWCLRHLKMLFLCLILTCWN